MVTLWRGLVLVSASGILSACGADSASAQGGVDKAQLAKFDINEDGWLSGTEVAACDCAGSDRDGDGEITAQEFVVGGGAGSDAQQADGRQGPAGGAGADGRPAPQAGVGPCTKIRMPWDKIDPCAAERAEPAPARTAMEAVNAAQTQPCTKIRMPWDKVDPCATRMAPPAPGRVTDADVRPATENFPDAAPRVITIGDVVEFDKMSDGKWGSYGVVTGFNGNPDSPCPWYNVRDAVVGIETNVICKRIRPATRAQLDTKVAGSAPNTPQQGPPVGSYFCNYGNARPPVLGPGQNFRIMSGKRYAADDGDAGTYTYNAATGIISFRGGFFGRMAAQGKFVGGRLNQIDISPQDGLLSYCSLQ